MKLKRFLKAAAVFVTIFALNCGIMVPYTPTVHAEEMTQEELEDLINQKRQENEERRDKIDQLDEDIANEEENRDEALRLLQDQKDLVDYYNNLLYYKDIDIAEKSDEISDKQSDIDKKDADIATAEENIAGMEAQNAENLEKFAEIIRTMYTSGSSDIMGILAGSDDFYSLMVGAEIMGNISEKNLEFMKSLEADIKKTKSDKKQLETDKANLLTEKSQLEEQKSDLEKEKDGYNLLLGESEAAAQQYENDYNKYMDSISEMENEQNMLNNAISVSESEIEEFEEQLKELIIAQTEKEKPLQQGEWIWPVPGRSYISCPFGWDPYFGRWHKGVDIGDYGIHGDSILATKGGTVIVAEHTYIPGYSYGMYVVVDHGGGYTSTYAHMSGVNVYVGQEVAQGDVLGYVGNTGFSTGPHLHFEIRINGEPQDPFGFVSIA